MESYPDRHQEPLADSRHRRQQQFDQINKYLGELAAEAVSTRDAYFAPDYSSPEAYRTSVEPYRQQLCRRLGFPPPKATQVCEPRYEHIADDAYASIHRMWAEVAEGVEVYGILMVPRSLEKPAPLLITQHGGGGSPEIVAAFGPKANYGWMMQRAVEHNYVAWAPGLIFRAGGEEEISGPSRVELDQRARSLGTSLLALETWKIVKGLDAILDRPEVDPSRVGMVGLSYGGLYTQYVAALDTRIQAAVTSCFFNSRWLHPKEDWTYPNCFNELVDAELAGLVCPRAMMVEVGRGDTLFQVTNARPEAARAASHWEKLGLSERFIYREFEGGHEFDGEGAYEFVERFLGTGREESRAPAPSPK
jgi:dienelactone hydrolase